MNILSYFKKENNVYLIFKLKPEEKDTFMSKLPEEYRKCYITDETLAELLSRHNGKISRNDIIKSKIPDPGSIMAGDFGEITSYFVIKEKYAPKKLTGPKKWRWKNDRTKASPYTDVIFFYKNEKPSKDDLVVAAEVKTKATKNTKNPILEAVNGMGKNYISKLAKTFAWLKNIYTTVEPDTNKIEELDRFINSQENHYGKYTKHFKAVAVIDSSFLDNDQKENVENPQIDGDGDFEIVVISLKDLKEMYESVYAAMLETR